MTVLGIALCLATELIIDRTINLEGEKIDVIVAEGEGMPTVENLGGFFV